MNRNMFTAGFAPIGALVSGLRRGGLLRVFLALFCVVLVGCKDIDIVHELDERDANEILVVLSRHDIVAKKEKVEKNQEVKWTVTVKAADEMGARQILVANNLPKVKLGGLSGICKDAGLILTPKTEKCREILAYKGEITNSLESIPGVVSADVVLNIPDKEEFPDEDAPIPHPTASVTIQYLKDGQSGSPLTEGKVQQFVANSVSNLDPRDVAVIITYLESGVPTTEDKKIEQEAADEALKQQTALANNSGQGSQNVDGIVVTGDASVSNAELTLIGGLKMDAASAKKFKVVAIMFLILFIILTISFIFVLLRLARIKKRSSAMADESEALPGTEADQKLLKA